MKDIMIWTDAEAYMGRGVKDPENDHEYNTIDLFLYPSQKPGVGVSIRTLAMTSSSPLCIYYTISLWQSQVLYSVPIR